MTLSKCGVQLLHSKLDNTEDPCAIVSLSGAEGKVFLVRVEQLKTPGQLPVSITYCALVIGEGLEKNTSKNPGTGLSAA